MVEAPPLEQLEDARSGDTTAFGVLIAPLVHPAVMVCDYTATAGR